MGELAPLIADLALILICAGVMTLIFKRLGQPLVLGYIVAGFIASPHFALTPSVIDTASIHVWSDIGVIFLLFALGLEFSFKKIVKVGGPAIIAALTIIFGMIIAFDAFMVTPFGLFWTIKNYDEGLTFGGLSNTNVKYLFLISGYLTNGYDFVNDTLTLLDMTKDEIKFYLKITDNLEEPDFRKKTVRCTIPSGASINKNELVEIRCIGRRANLGINNTDFILNWNLEENNEFQNIVVRWPYDLTKKKHIFYYDINGLSVKKEDHGCFENKFYFYLYVYDLKAEPKISFNLPLVFPKNVEAVCKLYNSVTFKCVIDLRLRKISKGTTLILPSNMTEYLPNKEQNLVLYKVNTNNALSSPVDFILPVQEDCGDYILVGALKDIGYTYLQVIIIIICIFAGLALCIFGVAFCVIYEITHRNRKGPYFKHTEEKEIPNTSVTQTQTNM